jgi:hypothetical protein
MLNQHVWLFLGSTFCQEDLLLFQVLDKVSGTKLYKIELNKISKEILKTQSLNYNLNIEEVKLIYSAQEYLKPLIVALPWTSQLISQNYIFNHQRMFSRVDLKISPIGISRILFSISVNLSV